MPQWSSSNLSPVLNAYIGAFMNFLGFSKIIELWSLDEPGKVPSTSEYIDNSQALQESGKTWGQGVSGPSFDIKKMFTKLACTTCFLVHLHTPVYGTKLLHISKLV